MISHTNIERVKLIGTLFPALFGLMLLSIHFSSCIDEYWPNMDEKYQELLVVDGMVTNQPPPYYIRLSHSTRTDRPEYKPLKGFQVEIRDNAGNSSFLMDLNDGTYQSPANGIQGTPGRSYKLIVTSPDGDVYESGFERMYEPVGIDTVYAEYEAIEDINYPFDLEGYRFYITTDPSNRDTTYFLWDLVGTYKYTANHYIQYIFDGELRQFADYDSLHTCWLTYEVPEIFTHHTRNISESYIEGFPLHYVNTLDKKLSIRYSLLTRQMVISEDAHTYWNNLKEQNENLGSLYPKQPFQVRGNINNVYDVDIPVLGYFTVAAVTENRIFVNRPWWVDFHYLTECNLITEGMSVLLWQWIEQWPLYLAAVYGETGGQAPALPTNQACVDCTKSGGTIIEPDFWIDK